MNPQLAELPRHLCDLNLRHMAEHYESLAQEAAREQFGHVEYLARLVAGEAAARYERSVARRIKQARLPFLKTLEQFNWTWPTKINRPQIQDIFRLRFVEHNANVVFIGGVGLGKTHLAIALAHTACLQDVPVRFTSAVDIVNALSAAQSANVLPKALKQYLTPRLLVIDGHQRPLRTRRRRADQQHGLQTVAPHLQQRRHDHLRRPRPPPASL